MQPMYVKNADGMPAHCFLMYGQKQALFSRKKPAFFDFLLFFSDSWTYLNGFSRPSKESLHSGSLSSLPEMQGPLHQGERTREDQAGEAPY